MKKCRLLFLGLASFLLWGSSCSSDNELEDIIESNTSVHNHEGDEVCTFDLINPEILEESNVSSNRAVIEKNNKWKTGEIIRIKFLNGNSFLQSKVKQYANEWMKYANLRFVFVPSNENADIKIAFKWNGDTGSWSYIGNYCRNISQNQPSMNFGWFTNSTPDSEFSRTVIHEFGHAIGLKHEHQHPTNNIQWNKPVVYSYYAQQGWDKSKVDHNVFQKLSTTSTNYSAYDRYSIMHYSIPSSHTTNGYSVGWNTILSTTDKQFISKQYPYSISLLGKAVPADYDGDGKIDIAYKTDTGIWYIDYAANGFGYWDAIYSGYGGNGATPVPADYDGDGKADLSVKTTSGHWLIDYAKNGFGKWDVTYGGYGGSDAIPVPADYDGDGKADLSVKTTSGHWLIDYAKNGFGKWDVTYGGYGGNGATPVPADYDGDGKADLSVKTTSGHWLIDYAKNGFGKWDVTYGGYGGNGAMPVPADYDGDGKADLSVKTTSGHWLIDYAKNGFGKWDVTYGGYGSSDAIPVPADYDGDRRADLSVKTSNGHWLIDYAKNGFGKWDWSYKY